LEAEVDAWFEEHPYEVFSEYHAGPPEQYLFKVRFLQDIPSIWGITLGDFLHNARSALDHVAYQVVVAGNGGMHRDGTQFPICVCPFRWNGAARSQLKGASDRHLAIIESLQPYHRRNYYGQSEIWSSLDDPLAVLNRLSNIDKHIVLNATPAVMSAIGWDFEIVNDVSTIGSSETPMGMLIDGEDMVRVNIVSSGPQPELKLNRSETVEIRVQYRVNLDQDSYTVRSVPLKEGMEDILSRLRDIFKIFVGEFR
jgi:hypothetical protein